MKLQFGENIKLPFFANFSVEQFDKHPDLMDLAFQAGLYHFGFGVQSGDEQFCKSVYNRTNNNRKITKVIEYLYKKGLSGFLYMIMGNPLENEINIMNTYNFILTLPRHDCSLKRRIHMETTKFFTPTGNVPITIKFPLLNQLNYNNDKFYYHAMMLEIALLYNKEEFMDIYNDSSYKKYPYLIANLYHDTVKNRYKEYIEKEIDRLKGKEVWFYGSGSTYHQTKFIFKDSIPKGILFDMDVEHNTNIDGIPIIHPSVAELINHNIPVVIFAKKENINYMYTKIQRLYTKFKDIVTCIPLDN